MIDALAVAPGAIGFRLNRSISSGVNVVTVSEVGRFSLPCAARKFAFFIIGAAVIGFFGINSCCVR